jgi:hypothetical protein
MKETKRLLLLLLAVAVTACSKGGVSGKLVSLGGAPTENPAAVAHIREGNVSVRGIDRYRLKAKEQPNPFADILFAITPGRHAILLMNIQKGHLVPYEDMRCYVVDADFLPNVTYRADEDKENQKATIRREDNGQVVGFAKLYASQTAVFGQPCQWK